MKDFNDTYSQSAINNFIFFEPFISQTKAAILPGNGCVSGDIARQAALLYKSGNVKKIIITGGACAKNVPLYEYLNAAQFDITEEDFKTDKSEAEYMQQILLDENINLSDIIFTERHASNTGENFEFIEPALRAYNIKCATIIGVAYGARRAYQTAKRVMPDVDFHPHPVYPYGKTREEWLSSWPDVDYIKKIIMKERAKLDPNQQGNYYEEGFCIDVPLPTSSWIKNSDLRVSPLRFAAR